MGGVRLNEQHDGVKWLDVSNQLLDEYLEIEAVEELPIEESIQKPPTQSEIRQWQSQASYYLLRLMSQQLSEANLSEDKGQIFMAVNRLKSGDVKSEYSIAQINQRLEQLGWITSA